MKNKNLVSLVDREPAERAEIARRGGIVSGMRKRKNRDMIQALQTLMQAKVKDQNGELVFVSEAIAENIVCGALEGDYRFTRLLTDHLYGTPYKRSAIEVKEGSNTVSYRWDDTLGPKADQTRLQEQLAAMDNAEIEKLIDIIEVERGKRGLPSRLVFPSDTAEVKPSSPVGV